MSQSLWEADSAIIKTNRPALSTLMQLINDYAGLKTTDQLVRKLEFVLKGLSDDELSTWVNAIIQDPYKTELPALIENLNNHETYFFRDLVQMAVLEKHIFPKLIQEKINQKDHTIKIWSAACSTGEEAYTLAMILLQTFIDFKLSVKLDGGLILPPHGWHIDINGTDISRQVIRKAQEGLYEESNNGLSSFRSFPDKYRQYFNQVEQTHDALGGIKTRHQVNPILKTFVKFKTFNLMHAIPPVNQCDLVLCRNLMIYLNPSAQNKAEQILKRSLRFGGFLMLSAVDKLNNEIGMTTHREKSCVYYEKR